MTDDRYNQDESRFVSVQKNDESFNGYANRETWAFHLHVSNDEGLYRQTLSVANELDLDSPEGVLDVTDYEIGEAVVGFWRDYLDNYTEETGMPCLPAGLLAFDREVGSWWRIDYAEVGAAVRESLDVES